MRADLARRWPEAMSPYTLNFFKFLQTQLDPAQKYIMHRADYSQLVSQQERILKLDTLILAADRKLAQYDKILCMRRLASISDQLRRFASDKDRASYERLLSCEESRL